ncbi:MAG TPA: alpha/beta hydrolase [Streptosporangiaceae bacterium]|nr:alpha/beta hydrolase [Streptosporangiaceae bacterium]
MTDSTVTVGSGDHHVVALHGWFGSARGWGALPDYLDPSAYTYAFMDLRGYGRRRDVAGDFTMQEAAADAVALADALGWDQFSLVGHSMSGQAIQHVLLQAPARVRRLVALNPVPATGVPMDEDGWALFSGAAASRDNRFAIINITTGGRLPHAFVDHIVQHSLDNSAAEAFGAYLDSWAKTDFSDRVKGNQAAVKVIVGEHDPALSAAVMEQTWLRFYPGAELEVVPNAGHYPMFETPAALAASIEEFLGRD